jgi:phosphoribosylformylglycinamidine synthase subunit PurL
LGAPPETLGASEYAAIIHGDADGVFPKFNLDAERRLGTALRALAAQGLLRSAQDISDGGLAIALAECCFPSGIGARIDLDGDAEVVLWSEDQGRAIVTCRADDLDVVLRIARDEKVEAKRIGTTGGDRLEIGGWINASVEELRAVWEAGRLND